MQMAHIVERSSGPGTPLLQALPSEGRSSAPTGGSGTRSKTIVLADAGRAPWYNAAGEPLPAYVVGIAGGSASGKTSVARAILKELPNVPWVAILSQDAFYKSLTREQSKLAFQESYDFDHPNAFDHELLKQCVIDLRNSKAVEIPVYSFVQHQRTEETTYIYGPAVLIVEGIFVLHDPELRKLLDLKIFVQADSDLMLARRIKRDILERGRSVNSVIDQYLRFVKPAFDNHVSITSKYADMIVPGMNNEVAIEVISQHMQKQLKNRAMRLRNELSKATPTPRLELPSPFEQLGSSTENKGLVASSLQGQGHLQHTGASNGQTRTGSALDAPTKDLPPNVLLLDQTPQLQGLLTALHDRSTPTSEFTFACKRVGTLVVELATTLLPYRQRTVQLHTGGSYVGMELDVQSICSVSILRSGSVLEPSLRRAFPAMSLGSLLIQSKEEDGEPYLYDVSLPSFIRHASTASKSWVFLLDAQIGTGAAAFMAIRVLLDHSVPEEQIIFVTLLASAKGGVHALHRAFPKVRIVVAGVDPGLEKLRIPLNDRRASSVQVSKSAPIHAVPSREGGDENESTPRLRQQRQPSVTMSPSPGKDSRVVFAITPGCGSIGDRFWGTGAR